MEVGLVVIAFLTFLAFYFLPSAIGGSRRVANIGALLLVNFLTGWTGIGWIGCIIWAACGHTADQDRYYREAVNGRSLTKAERKEALRQWRAEHPTAKFWG